MLLAGGEVVWSWRLDAGVTSAEACHPNRALTAIFADNGDKKARSPGRARSKPLKPLRAGMPGDPGATVVTTLVCYQHTAHEAAGATGTRHSPRPLIFGAKDSCTTRAHRAAGSRSLVREGRLLFELNPHASSRERGDDVERCGDDVERLRMSRLVVRCAASNPQMGHPELAPAALLGAAHQPS